MIRPTMALAALGSSHLGRAEYARDARLARLVALGVDTVFFSIIAAIAGAVYGVTEVNWGSPLPAGGGGVAFYGTQTAIPWIAVAVIYVVYFTVPEAMFGASPGKAVCRLRVTTVDGRPLSTRAVVIRNVLKLVDGLPVLYLIGGIAVLLSPSSQRLGDMAAGTTVVYRHRAPAPGETRTSSGRARLALAAGVVAVVLFTAFFDYFGRPPLVIQGLYNEHQLMDPDIVSYKLGAPTWFWGRVVYPITAQTQTKHCTGTFELDWYGLMGWQASSGQLDCFPS